MSVQAEEKHNMRTLGHASNQQLQLPLIKHVNQILRNEL